MLNEHVVPNLRCFILTKNNEHGFFCSHYSNTLHPSPLLLFSSKMAAVSASIRRRRVHQSAAASEQLPAQKSDSSSTIVDLRRTLHNRQKKRIFSLRDQFIRTNVDIYLLGTLFVIINGLTLHLQVVEAMELSPNDILCIDGTKSPAYRTFLWTADVYAIFFPM